MIETRPCSKCGTVFQPKPYQVRSGNYKCKNCVNAEQREYLKRKKEKDSLSESHADRGGMTTKDRDGGKANVTLPKIELPGNAETEKTREVLKRYGLEIDEQALVAARAVKAGFPIKNLPGILGRDFLLYCVMSDMMNVKHAQIRMRYLEMAGQLTGVIQNGASAPVGGVNVMQVSFNEIGIKPGNGTSLSGKKPNAVIEAEPVPAEASP